MAEDLRLFGITDDWNTAALYLGAKCSTVREGGCRFVAAWVKQEEKASESKRKRRPKARGKGVRTSTEEERSGRGGQG